jgi:hypothetical protein
MDKNNQTDQELKLADKVEAKPAKKRSFKRRLIMGCLAGCGCLALIVALILIVLALVKPEIEVDFIKTADQFNLPEQINAHSDYPKLEFAEEQRIKSAAGRNFTGKNINFSAEDFQEGENKFTLEGYRDFFFVSFVAKDKLNATVQVDRIAPEVQLSKSPDKFLLLEDPIVELKVKEQNLRFYEFTGDKEVEIKPVTTSETDDLGITTFSFKFPAKDGENSLELIITDPFKNFTKILPPSFKAFAKAGYAVADCAGLRFAYNTNKLQIGMFNGPGTPNPRGKSLTTCGGPNMSAMLIAPKGYTFPCSGACDVYPFALAVNYQNRSLAATITAISKDKKKTFDQEVTNNMGMKGKHVKFEYDNIMAGSGKIREEYVLFEKDGKTYFVFTDSTADAILNPNRLNYFNETWQNAKF